MTMYVYRGPEAREKLARVKHVLALFGLRNAAVLASILLVIGGPAAASRYFDFPPLRWGVPWPLKDRVADLGLSVSHSQCYRVGGILEATWLWRARISEADVKRLASGLSMHGASPADMEDPFCNWPPYWWRPAATEQKLVFSKGEHTDRQVMVVWNPEDQILHLRYYDSF
jgi:hypothetical protein